MNNNKQNKTKIKKGISVAESHWSEKYNLSPRSFRGVDWSIDNKNPIKREIFQPTLFFSPTLVAMQVSGTGGTMRF